jgi:hypothetical protein
MMNLSDTIHLSALVNFALCTAIGACCVVRFSTMNRNTRLIFRAMYALLFIAASSSGWQPLLWNEWPGLADLITNSALLLLAASGLRTWRQAVPAYACKTARELTAEELRHVAGGGRQS